MADYSSTPPTLWRRLTSISGASWFARSDISLGRASSSPSLSVSSTVEREREFFCFETLAALQPDSAPAFVCSLLIFLDPWYLGMNPVKCLVNCFLLDQSHWLGRLLCFWCTQRWSIFLSFRLCPICLLSVHRPDKIEGSEFSSISGKHCTCCNFIVLITFMPFFHSHVSIFVM